MTTDRCDICGLEVPAGSLIPDRDPPATVIATALARWNPKVVADAEPISSVARCRDVASCRERTEAIGDRWPLLDDTPSRRRWAGDEGVSVLVAQADLDDDFGGRIAQGLQDALDRRDPAVAPLLELFDTERPADPVPTRPAGATMFD